MNERVALEQEAERTDPSVWGIPGGARLPWRRDRIVAKAIRHLVGPEGWQGTAGELADALQALWAGSPAVLGLLPTNGWAISRRLESLEGEEHLARIGLRVEWGRRGGRLTLHLRRVEL